MWVPTNGGVEADQREATMRKWRREAALDLYNLLLAMFLLISPWLFARANGIAAMDLRASGAVIAILSLPATWLSPIGRNGPIRCWDSG